MATDTASDAPPDLKPCPACGKSASNYLTLRESIEVAGYGKTTCMTCLLTEFPRPKQA